MENSDDDAEKIGTVGDAVNYIKAKTHNFWVDQDGLLSCELQ